MHGQSCLKFPRFQQAIKFIALMKHLLTIRIERLLIESEVE